MLLTPEELTAHLAHLPGWQVRDNHLTKTFTDITFAHAVMFLVAAAHHADAAGHHPDITLHDYNRVTIRITTHSAGGLTEKDVALAGDIERLPHKPPKK